MHVDEVETDADLVRALLASQHPQWARLPIERVSSAGTDNAMYRLGDDLAVRLPRIHWAVDSIAKERTWLPILAPHLPLAVPLPVAVGQPEAAFPYPWSVVQWLPGELATLERLDDPVRAALDLAAFVRALQSVDATGGPKHNRGRPLRRADAAVRKAIAASARRSRRDARSPKPGTGRWLRRSTTARRSGFTATWPISTCSLATASSPASSIGAPAASATRRSRRSSRGASSHRTRAGAYRDALGIDDADVGARQRLGADRRDRHPVLPRHEPDRSSPTRSARSRPFWRTNA